LNLLKKLKIVLCLFWLFLAEADNNLPHNIQNARLSIGQIKNRYYLGTGFFVNQNHFLTNFHAIEGMLNKQSFQDIYITQDHIPHQKPLKLKKIISLSMDLDLALLEVDGSVDHFFTLHSQEVTEKKNLLVIGYPQQQFRMIKKIGPLKTGILYNYFPADYFYLYGMSGSPVLDLDGNILGITSIAKDNLVFYIKFEHLKNFLKRAVGFNCSGYKPKDCLMRSIEHSHQQAHHGGVAQIQNIVRFINRTIQKQQNHFDLKLIEHWLNNLIKENKPTVLQHWLADLMIIKSGQIDEHTFDVLLQSAESHYPPAQYVVSLSYFVRPEIKNHLDKALYWLRLSAEQEYVPAQYLLGNMLAHKDFEQALYWWNKAASYGHTGSLNKLNMPKDQAQELSLTKPFTGIYN